MDASLPILVDVLISLLLVTGGVFAFIGSFGLAKLRDFYLRIHGPTKATTLGIGATLIASMLFFAFATPSMTVHELLVTLFMFVTAPVSAHMLTKAHLKQRPGDRPPQPARDQTARASAETGGD